MSNGVPRLHIELTDELHTRAKIAAALRHSTLKALVIESLERVVVETDAEHGDMVRKGR